MSLAQPDLHETPIQVVLPRSIDASSCKFQYFLIGEFGGYGRSDQLKSGTSGYEIETAHNGSTAESLRAFLACTGYQVEAIVVNSLPPSDARRLVLALEPLPTVRFAGVIRGWTTPEIERRFVDVEYVPWWTCRFFNLADCGVGQWTLATVPIENDGTFAVNLPDLWRDPVIASFRTKNQVAELMFRIRDQRTGNPIFTLKPAGSAQPGGGLQVQPVYSTEQAFELEPSP
jgi:hypothetical protein